MEGTNDAPAPSQLGIGLAMVWLVVGSLGCLWTVGLLFTPEVAANVALITVPLCTSGWGSVAAAVPARKRERSEQAVAVVVGAVGGLALGLIAIAVLYTMLWPSIW